MKQIPCEVVRDLFPSYLDHLTSDVTDRVVGEHVASCENCRTALERMRGGEAADVPDPEEKKELDFLKKTRRRGRRAVLIGILAAAAVFGAILFIRFCVTGHYLYGDWVVGDVRVDGTHLAVDVTSVDSGTGISGLLFKEEDGVVTVGAKAVLATPIHSGSCHGEFEAEHPIRRVVLSDRIVWDDGADVSPLAAQLYETRHDYVGDAPANSRTAQVLNLSGYLGAYTSALETAAEPYGWRIVLGDAVPEEDRSLKESDMRSFAYVLLALVGNLDRVTFEYTVAPDASGADAAGGDTAAAVGGSASAELTFTAEEATRFFGQDIKDCGYSIRLLDSLLEKTGLKRLAFGESAQPADGGAIRFDVANRTGRDLKGIGIALYRDGELRSSHGAEYADGTLLKEGASFRFDILPEDLRTGEGGSGESGIGECEIGFTVIEADGTEIALPDRIRIPGGCAELNRFSVIWTETDGYTVNQ